MKSLVLIQKKPDNEEENYWSSFPNGDCEMNSINRDLIPRYDSHNRFSYKWWIFNLEETIILQRRGIE